MGCYVLAVGGTGNKILESLVYAAAADRLYTLDPQGERRPIPEVYLLSVDVDAACGNTTRAKRAAEYYQQLQEAFKAYPAVHRGFHTALTGRRWSMNLARRAMSVDKMVQNHSRDQLLAQTLFSRTESALEYSEGFRGHPDLGVLFFADLLGSLETLRKESQPDEMNAMLDRMKQELANGEKVKVILCGSIFGGTGASGIPAIARYLRQYFAADNASFELAAMLMLPYYKVPPSSQNEELEIVVKSSTFMDKARTALQYYGMEGLIREGESDPKGAFDALYLLGLPPEAFVTTNLYSTGSQSQENDAHLMEWLAARCIARFFRTGFRGAEAHNIDCYYYQWHTPQLCWDSFDQEGELYRTGYGGLLKAAALFFAECWPTLRRLVAENEKKLVRVGYCAPYFHHLKDNAERTELEALLDSTSRFMAFYANWIIQVVRTIPPTLREQREQEQILALARENYGRLLEREVLLEERAQESAGSGTDPEEQRLLEAECQEMQRTRALLLPQVGGSAWLEVLKAAQDSAREQLYRRQEETAMQQERMERWMGEDSHLIDPQTLAQEQERLTVMRRVRDSRERLLARVGQDIQNAIRENVIERYPAPTDGQAGCLPENGLLNAKLLDQLYILLTEYGKPAAQRQRAVMEKASTELQRNLTGLVVQRVPDNRGTGRIIAALGGGERLGTGAAGRLCSFLSVLFSAATEEVL